MDASQTMRLPAAVPGTQGMHATGSGSQGFATAPPTNRRNTWELQTNLRVTPAPNRTRPASHRIRSEDQRVQALVIPQLGEVKPNWRW